MTAVGCTRHGGERVLLAMVRVCRVRGSGWEGKRRREHVTVSLVANSQKGGREAVATQSACLYDRRLINNHSLTLQDHQRERSRRCFKGFTHVAYALRGQRTFF